MPPLELVRFNGTREESFEDYVNLFRAAVDGQDLKTTQQMQYLRSILGGSEFSLIKHFVSVGNNYDEAIEFLSECYSKFCDNNKNKYLKDLQDIRKLSGCRGNETIRQLYNFLIKQVSILKGL